MHKLYYKIMNLSISYLQITKTNTLLCALVAKKIKQCYNGTDRLSAIYERLKTVLGENNANYTYYAARRARWALVS